MNYKTLIPAFIWGGVIFLVIGASPDQIPKEELLRLKNVDKAVHFFLFFVFSVLLAGGLFHRNKASSSNISLLIITLIIGITYGAVTEFIQFAALPERHGDVFDLLANTIGTIFGVMFYSYVLKPRHSPQNKQIKK